MGEAVKGEAVKRVKRTVLDSDDARAQLVIATQNLFAAEIEMDPAEVRRVNLIPADAFPKEKTGDVAGWRAYIKKTKKLSPRERKMKKQQMLRALEDEVCTVVGQTVPASDYSDMQCAGDGCARSFSGTNPCLEATQCSECQRWFCKIDCSDAYSLGLQWMCNGCVACL